MNTSLSLQTHNAPNVGFQNQKCILLVEDYKPNILVATTLLEQFGYSYEIATNGLDAIQKVSEKKFDAVLMDVQMQGIDGFETTKRIREAEKKDEPRLYIIAMTARALSGDREKCIAAGMDDYMSKPFRSKEFHEKLTKLFSGELAEA